ETGAAALNATVLETDRLLLQRFTADPEESEFALRLLNEPSYLQNIGDKGVRTLEQAAKYLREGPIKSYELHGHGLYRVVLKETAELVGICGLLKRDQFKDADLGYAFLPEFWSRGFAFESASAVLEYGRETLGLSKVIALVNPANAPSINLLKKLGFSFSETVKMESGGAVADVYELLSQSC
ncbi:MAG TPA: GNAT family N-acetyltransferase, partial [Thermoanaerobaculia bacterium]|nr:GNAT family N-acetyltransferase [Thermoanaerobaculia bacterium]